MNTPDQPPQHKAPLGLRTVAIYECVKGFLALLAVLALLSLLHRDAGDVVESIVHALGINPEQHYVRWLIEKSGNMTDANKRVLAGFAAFYALTRFIITYGLWRERHWAELFAVISACVYFPLEIHHIIRKPVPTSLIIPTLNVIVVIYLARLLAAGRRKRKAVAAALKAQADDTL